MEFQTCQELVRAKLIDAQPRLTEGALDAQLSIARLLDQAMTGECVSALLVGPVGSGKSSAVRGAVSELGGKVIHIELNGEFCSDDRACMREIFWQLVKKMRREDDGKFRKVTSTGSLTMWIAKLAQLLRESTRAGYLVFVCLDKFEAFCQCKSKQGLLYNLYDLMQQPEIKFACLGLTSKVDATDHLEKRIKSRFQLRRIVVRTPLDMKELTSIVTDALVTNRKSFDEAVKKALADKEVKASWTFYFDAGFSVRDFVHASIRAVLRAKDIPSMKTELIGAMHVFETSMDTEAAVANTLRDLTLADHMVLVALSKLHKKGFRPKSFASVYMELTSFEKTSQGQVFQHDRKVYWKSFLKLRSLNIISVTESSSADAWPLSYCPCRLVTLDMYISLFEDSDTARKNKFRCLDTNPLHIVPSAITEWAVRGNTID